MTELALPDETAIAENVAKILGIPTDFLAYFAENRTQIKVFLDNLRPDMGAMAELKLLEQIANGDAATIRWALPRLMPKQYHLTNSPAQQTIPENVRILYDDEIDV